MTESVRAEAARTGQSKSTIQRRRQVEAGTVPAVTPPAEPGNENEVHPDVPAGAVVGVVTAGGIRVQIG